MFQFFVGAGENLDEAGLEKVDPDAAAFDLGPKLKNHFFPPCGQSYKQATIVIYDSTAII